jgi:sugar/nucleoside kinase (ribokinase family)
MLTSTGTIGGLRRSLIDPALLNRTRHVHVSSYYLQRALAPELPAVFREARANGTTISLDPNWDPSGAWDDGLLGLLPDVDVFLPNEMEALSIARISDVEQAVMRLRAAGAGTVVVKAAGDGSVGGRGTELVRVPSIATEVVDTTGSGDSFDAGFLAGYLADEPLGRCLQLGNACGALSTLGVGGTEAQATMAEALDAVERGSAA